MPQLQPSQVKLSGCEPLRRFCERLLVAAGLEAGDAHLVADSLVEANLRGIDSHGVARLGHYLTRIRHGSIEVRPRISIERCAPAAARLDGGHGLGQIAHARAAKLAVELARDCGAGWVSIRNSSHCGALAYFGLMIAEAGMIGVVLTHVDPMVVPFGATEPYCGTNPICITAPGADGQSLCLDMATSITPWNSIANAGTEGMPIPEDWAVDEGGRATTNPAEVVGLHPLGGYKGSGLGMMIDVLCAMLSGSPYGPDIPKMYGDLTERRRLGGLVGAIDISRFVELGEFQQRVSQMIARWNVLRPAEPGGRVLYPGEPELISRAKRMREGIPLGRGVWNELTALAGRYKVAALDGDGKPGMVSRDDRD